MHSECGKEKKEVSSEVGEGQYTWKPRGEISVRIGKANTRSRKIDKLHKLQGKREER